MTKFVYVTYIHTTAEKLWEALTQPEFTRQYWVGITQECTWEQGAAWKIVSPDGRVADSGEVLEIEKPKRLVLKWRHELIPEMREEGDSRCTLELEPQPLGIVKLTVVHESDVADSKVIGGVSQGWPKVFASVKTLLETGSALPGTNEWPKGM